MKVLFFLMFSLYQGSVVHGADDVNLENKSYILRIASDVSEVKSMLKDILEELKNQKSGSGCSSNIQYELNELKSTVAGQKVRLEALEKQFTDKYRVAFSASLFGNGGTTVGGYATGEILKFQNVFTNIGEAYSLTTGKFTAPVKGVYYFGFSAFANGQNSMGVHLRKNGKQIVATYDYNNSHKDVNGANRAVLVLEKGDEVYIELWSGLHIFDSYNSVSTFSGFLISAM